jgi:hypothetical protein
MVSLPAGVLVSINAPSTNTNGSLYVYWGSSSKSSSSYTLEQSTDGSIWTGVYTGTNNYSYVGVTANGTYTFRVKAAKTGYGDNAYTTSATGCIVTK